MCLIEITSNIRNYTAQIGSINECMNDLINLEHKTFLIDEKVYQIYQDTLLEKIPEEMVLIFPAQEKNKTLNGARKIIDYLLEKSAKKNLTLVTIGGGILQDVSGFVASTLYRGINWLLIPTTLLSMADSCIGSKTSINYRGYKNLIGTFYPPSKVWIDPLFVNTLKKADYYSGLGEVIKLHIMGGPSYIHDLQTNYASLFSRDISIVEKSIYDSLQIKLSYISGDEFDQGRRNLLNYGHCVGHAIESVTNFRIPHGQAVIIGMAVANRVSCSRGTLSKEKCSFFETSLLLPALIKPLHTTEMDLSAITEAMGKDKKRTGKGLALVMAADEDFFRIDDLKPEEIGFAFRDLEEKIVNRGRLV